MIEGFNSWHETMDPIYEVSMNGTVKNTNVALFKDLLLEDNYYELGIYYDKPKTVSYLKRRFKTVYEIVA